MRPIPAAGTTLDGHTGCEVAPSLFLAMAAEVDRARHRLVHWAVPRPLTHPLIWGCRARELHPLVLDALDGAAPTGEVSAEQAHAREAVADELGPPHRSGAAGEWAEAPYPGVTLLVNGRVFTVDPAAPWAEAVAFEGERILAVGSTGDLTGRFPRARRIDVAGRVVIPGLNDAHMHHTPDPRGVRLPVDAAVDPTLADLDAALEAAVAAVPEGTWIFGTIGLGLIVEEDLDREHLDAIAPGHPVALLGLTNHTNVFNSAALAVLGIEESAPDVLGGRWRRDAAGRLTGRVDEYAQWRPQRTFAAMTGTEEGAAAIRDLSDACMRFGVTTVQNMSWTPADRYVRMALRADVPLRIRLIDFPGAGTERERVPPLPERQATTAGHPRVTRSGRKWILDGTPVEYASDFGTPYLNGASGALNFPDAEVDGMVADSVSGDDQLLLHAIGTRTVRQVVRALDRDTSGSDWRRRRLRIEHADGALPEDVAALHAHGAMIVQNPSHFLFTGMYADRWGTGHPYSSLRSVLDTGMPVGIGSDGPLNPFISVFGAIAHPTRMSEAIDMGSVITAYTAGSAYAEGTEREKGRLAAGYLADIAVLDRDVFSTTGPELMETRSVLTIVGGRIAYRAD